jgi:carboxypeptidase Taq
MEEKFKVLKEISAEITDLGYAAAVLEWDQHVYLPPMGIESRGNQMSILQQLIHLKSSSPELGKLLEELNLAVETLDPDSEETRLVKVTKRHYEMAVKVPSAFTAEFAKLTTIAFGSWQQAREENDFSKFQPHLQKIVEMARQFSEYFAPYDHVYDPLLDRFEPGMKTSEVIEIFDSLRPKQVELVQVISEAPQVDDSFLYKSYDEQKQWDFGVDVITRYGYDWKRGRQDNSHHPFTTTLGANDVRITTRVDGNSLSTALFSTLHECGHALYELGVSPAYERHALSGGASYALHESQSRMYENLVGRSMPFWEFFYPRLQKTFPGQLNGVGLEIFYKGINKVEPSLIRVEADEATYNLHIMLRLEIEIALMEGKIEVRDLPDVWNTKMQEYLGVTPTNDANGVLQDVHWASGQIGYFSTYALGNLISVQLWEKMIQDITDMEDQIRKGEFGNLLDWLVKNVHIHGKKFEPQELVQRVTGSRIDPDPYMRYLTSKYKEIYGL